MSGGHVVDLFHGRTSHPIVEVIADEVFPRPVELFTVLMNGEIQRLHLLDSIEALQRFPAVSARMAINSAQALSSPYLQR